MAFPRARSGEAGFTLIESLVAIVILSFGLVAIANLFVVATASNRTGNLVTVATAEASETMERLKVVPFNTLKAAAAATGRLDKDLPSLNATDNVIVGGAVQFNRRRILPGIGTVITRWTIVDPNAGGGDTLFITVRSEVVGFLGRGARVQFGTYRTCTSSGCAF